MRKLLFALMLSSVAATASAACQKFNPDGTIEACQHMPFGAPLSPPGPQQASASPCQLGGTLAYKAYLEGTYDAQRPDGRKLHYLVDYWGDMMVAKHDRKIAHRAVDYVAIRLQATGMRQPWDGAVYEVAREFIARECSK
jgi:hypothetical protein